MSEFDAAVQIMLDKQDINEVLARYCHGLDKRDRSMLESIYWPEAIEDHAGYQGSADGLIDHALDYIGDDLSFHTISSVLIEFDDESRARSDSYYLYQGINREDEQTFLVGGRYSDQFEKRNGEWRMIYRRVYVDFKAPLPSEFEKFKYK